jgi:hypothetical protein
VLAEQYFLVACLRYHADNPHSELSTVEMRYLFDSVASAGNRSEAERVGYTHLIAGAKRDAELAERLELRVRNDYPKSHERVARYCAAQNWA